MHLDLLYEWCMAKKGVSEHFPFDDDVLVFKVGGKLFCLTSLSSWEKGEPALNLKCNPDKSEQLRANYHGITPGYHMNKKHWNTVRVNEDVPDFMILELLKHSFDLVFTSLPKKTQLDLLNY